MSRATARQPRHGLNPYLHYQRRPSPSTTTLTSHNHRTSSVPRQTAAHSAVLQPRHWLCLHPGPQSRTTLTLASCSKTAPLKRVFLFASASWEVTQPSSYRAQSSRLTSTKLAASRKSFLKTRAPLNTPGSEKTPRIGTTPRQTRSPPSESVSALLSTATQDVA